MKKKILFFIVLLVALVVTLLYSSHFREYLTLEMILNFKKTSILYIENNYVKVIVLFFLFNIFICTLPIPGNSLVSFTSGAFFGFIPGLLISSFAMGIGNVITFLITRYFLGDWVKEKLKKKYNFESSQFEKEEVMLLFSMRVFPLIPSFIATIMMALSSMKCLTFFLVTLFARMPLIMLYSWTGSKMIKVTSLEDILSMKLIAVFLLIAILPWIPKLRGIKK